ncbi:MAG: heme-binding protein [Lautropia sp.]|nr:heme-binding protein [Lautropia sp.]
MTLQRSLLFLALTLGMGAASQAAEPVKTLPGDLTLKQAQQVLVAAIERAEAIKVPVNIAVVDAGGHLKAFARMDDAFLGSVDIATRKAKTARYFNMSTRALGKAAQPGQPLYGIEETNDGLVIFAGGVLLVDQNEHIIGGIGVSGGTVDQDEDIANVGAGTLSP